MKYLMIIATVCLLACGCSSYDRLSEKHAQDNSDGLSVDLNNGLDYDAVRQVIFDAYELANPEPDDVDAMTDAEVERRNQNFIAFSMKIHELVLSDISVEIAVARAEAWLRYEQSKRKPKDGDVPRLLEEEGIKVRDSDGESGSLESADTE